MTEAEFKERTIRFGVDIIRLVDTLPNRKSADVIGRQLVRASMSVGANYRAACRGRSTADMIAKLKIVEEECDEAIYWMEMLKQSGIVPEPDLRKQMREANEILAMTVASIKTLRARQRRTS